MAKRAVESGPGLYSTVVYVCTIVGKKGVGWDVTRYKEGYLLQYCTFVTSKLHRKVKVRSGCSGCPWRGCTFPFSLFRGLRGGGGKSGDDSVVHQVHQCTSAPVHQCTDPIVSFIFLPVTCWDLREIPMGRLFHLGHFSKALNRPSKEHTTPPRVPSIFKLYYLGGTNGR